MSENKSFDLMSMAPDKEMSQEGVWVDFFDNARLKIAQRNNPKHQRHLTQQYKIHRRKIDLEDENADKLADKISLEGLAKYVLLDWENMTWNGQENIPYTPELGFSAMTNVPVLRKEVEDQSDRLQNFQAHNNEEDLINVKPSSPGTSSGDPQND